MKKITLSIVVLFSVSAFAQLAVYNSDYVSGKFGWVNSGNVDVEYIESLNLEEDHPARIAIEGLGQDTLVRSDGSDIYFLDGTNGQVIRFRSASNQVTVSPVSFANPRDLLRVGDYVYVTQYNASELLVLDAASLLQVSQISLSEYDADGVPEMHQMLARNGELFVSLQKLDYTVPDFNFAVINGSIVVIDLATEQVTFEIELDSKNPVTRMVADSENSFVIASTGNYDSELDSAIERIHVESMPYESEVLYSGSDVAGEMSQIEKTPSENDLFVGISSGINGDRVSRYEIAVDGEVSLVNDLNEEAYVLSGLVLDSDAQRLFVGHRGKGILAIDTTNDTEVISETILYSVNELPPYSMSLFDGLITSAQDIYESLNQLKLKARVFPNPVSAKGMLTVEFNSARDQRCSLRAYTPVGQLVHNQVLEALAGQNRLALSVQKLSKGVNYLRIECDAQQVSLPVVIH